MAKRNDNRTATIAVNIGGKTCGLLKVPENIAVYLSTDKKGIFGIENFLGEKLLNQMGYKKYPYASKSISIYSGNGIRLFPSCAYVEKRAS